jgi:hypothetical protein
VKGQEDATHLGQGKLNAPDFALVSETVLSGELKYQHAILLIPVVLVIFQGDRCVLSLKSPSDPVSLAVSSSVRLTLMENQTHLELGVETGSLVRSLGNLVGFRLLPWCANHLIG